MNEKQLELLKVLWSLLSDIDQDKFLAENYGQALEEEKRIVIRSDMLIWMWDNVEDDEETGIDHIKYCLRCLLK